MVKPVYDQDGVRLRPGDPVVYNHQGFMIRTVVKHIRRNGDVHIARGWYGVEAYVSPRSLLNIRSS